MSMPRTQRTRTHGMYAQVITAAEEAQLAQMQPTNIEGEVAYLRVVCSRLAKIVNANGLRKGAKKPLDDRTLRMLNALDAKMNTLLRYVRTLAYLKGQPNEYEWKIEEGEFLARKRQDVFNYFGTRTTEEQADGAGAVDADGAEPLYPLDRGGESEAIPEGATEE